jgi:hypothetical protein
LIKKIQTEKKAITNRLNLSFQFKKMKTAIEQRWDELSASRELIMMDLSTWSKEQFAFQPADGWSASQVIEHIMSSETGTLGYMKKKSSGGWETLSTTSEQEKASSEALNKRLASNEKFKAPPVLPEPSNTFSYTELKSGWDKLRAEMHEFILTIEEQHFDKLVFRQPAAGMLNILQAMEFLNQHILHHIPQIERIKQSQNFG